MADFNGAFANAPYGSEAVPFATRMASVASIGFEVSAAGTFVVNPRLQKW